MVLTHCVHQARCAVFTSARGVGSWVLDFVLQRDPRGLVVGGQKRMPAQVQVSLWRRTKTQQPPPDVVCPHWPRLAPGAGRVKVEPAFSALFPAKALEPRASSSCLFPYLRPERQPRASGWGRWQVTGWEALLSRGRWAVGISPCSSLSHTAVPDTRELGTASATG